MKSFQLKLIIIALFLGVNIFFILKISTLYSSKNIFSQEEIFQAVDVVNKKGIKIDKSVVINTKNIPNVIKLDFNSFASEAIAKRVMREKYGSFTIPNGFSYSNDSESLSFSNNYDLEYVYLPSKIEKETVLTALEDVTSADEKGEKSAKKLTKIFFKDINSDPYSVWLLPTKSITLDSVTYVEAKQFVNDYEINGASIVAVLKDDKLLFVSGKLFFAENYKDYTTDALDSINILFEIEENDSEIKSMELIYTTVFDSNNSVYLTPSYRFVYSDKTSKIYDATSAAKRS